MNILSASLAAKWHLDSDSVSMSDNTNNRGPQDRSKINLSEEWEMQYWTEKLGVSKEALERAVSAVGSGADKVEAYLKANS